MRAAESGVTDGPTWARCRLLTPLGELLIGASSAGLRHVAFHGAAPETGNADPAAERMLDEACQQLREYFDRERDEFTVDIDWSFAEGFRHTVLRTLYEQVGCGHTVSYAELAALAGRPNTARVVGGIMGGNEIPIVVPCHRVLGSNGLGGYGPGLETKRALLVREGVLQPTLLDDLPY